MKLNWIPLLAILSTNAQALDLELGLGVSDTPLYTGVPVGTYATDYSQETTVGIVQISHTFKVTNFASIKLWADHRSLPFKEEPSLVQGVKRSGKNTIGASVVVKIF